MSARTAGWVPLGHQQYVSTERQLSAGDRMTARIADAKARKRHLWVAAVAYFVHPPIEENTILDADNIVGPPGVGCYICERDYEPGHENARCPGEPR